MTDADDPFDDLEDDLENRPDAHSDGAETTAQRNSSEEVSGTQQPRHQSAQCLDNPAFSFDTTTQHPLYARPETWDTFGDTLLEVEFGLREYDIREVPKRELHDAALQVLTDHTDELVEAVVAKRREGGPGA